MTISQTIDFLNDFRSKSFNISTSNKSNVEKFVSVLNELKFKNFENSKIEEIEAELTLIIKNFEIEREKINVKAQLRRFLKFLKVRFSLIVPHYNLYFGMFVGAIVSILFGIITVLLGVFFGAVVGFILDNKAKKENRVFTADLGDFMFS